MLFSDLELSHTNFFVSRNYAYIARTGEISNGFFPGFEKQISYI